MTQRGPDDRVPARGVRDRILRHAPAWLQEPGAPGLVGLMLFLLVVGVVVLVVARTPAVLILVALLGSTVLRSRHRRATAAPPPPAVAPAPAPDHAWSDARTRFAALRSAYAAHECDAMAVLRLPALSDVSVPSTARFVDAFAEAQALETDAHPGVAHAGSFGAAVERAGRAWQAAREAAERIRHSGLAPAERHTVERVLKLLTTARDSDSEPERLSAYAFARAELARLDRAGVIHVPPTARAALEADGRGQLPA